MPITEVYSKCVTVQEEKTGLPLHLTKGSNELATQLHSINRMILAQIHSRGKIEVNVGDNLTPLGEQLRLLVSNGLIPDNEESLIERLLTGEEWQTSDSTRPLDTIRW